MDKNVERGKKEMVCVREREKKRGKVCVWPCYVRTAEKHVLERSQLSASGC